MRLRYVGTDALEIPSLAVIVTKGDEVEATGDEAKSLIAQGLFERVEAKAAAKAAEKEMS